MLLVTITELIVVAITALIVVIIILSVFILEPDQQLIPTFLKELQYPGAFKFVYYFAHDYQAQLQLLNCFQFQRSMVGSEFQFWFIEFVKQHDFEVNQLNYFQELSFATKLNPLSVNNQLQSSFGDFGYSLLV